MLRTRSLIAALLVAIASAFGPSVVSAQSSCGVRGMGNFTVTLSPTAIVFPAPGLADFLSGRITLPTPLQITVNPQSGVGNNDWFLCVRSPQETLGGSAKPLAHLEFYNAETGSWIPLSGAFVELATYSGTANRTISVPVRMLLDWETDPPGSYGPTSLVFEVAR